MKQTLQRYDEAVTQRCRDNRYQIGKQ